MYSFRRRIGLSLIIPLFVLLFSIPLFLPNTNQTAPNTSSLTVQLWLLLQLLVAYLLSIFFLSVETLFKYFIADKDSSESKQVRTQLGTASLSQKIDYLENIETTNNQSRITHSVLFQVMLLVLALYAATSGNSLIGIILTLSLLLQVIVDQVLLFRKGEDLSSWLWQIHTSYPRNVQLLFVVASVLIFIWSFIIFLQKLPILLL